MKKSAFQTYWKQYEPLIEAICSLFHPFVEVAVHDLEKGVLAVIYHNISQRKVGEPSPIKELGVEVKDFPDYFLPYYKQNHDGRPLKCSSITLRDARGKPVGLICINVDASFFQESYRLISAFLKTDETAENPVELFGGECQNQINSVIDEYLDEKELSLRHLTREQKREVVLHLYKKGIFNYKNAVPILAETLKLSRASIYNYIKRS